MILFSREDFKQLAYKREAFPKPLSKYILFEPIQKHFTPKKSGSAVASKTYKFLDTKNYRGCARDFWDPFDAFPISKVSLKCILFLHILPSLEDKN